MIGLSVAFKEWYKQVKLGKAVVFPVKQIVESILSEEDLSIAMQEVRNTYNLNELKLYALDFLILYANELLSDNFISEDEMNDFSILKIFFKIEEGDFIRHRSFEVREILTQQFIRMYADDFVDEKEAIESVNLQALFDLGYDQFEQIKEDKIIAALLKGASPKDLDISSLPKSFKQ